MKDLKKALKWIWIPIISLLIGITGELVYNLPIDKQNDYTYIDMEDISAEGFHLINGSSYISDGNVATLTINFEKQYVDKFTYEFEYDKINSFGCSIVVRTYPDGQNATEKNIEDRNNYILSKSTVNVHAVADQIRIVTPEGSSPVTISKIAINNTENYSVFRIVFVSLCTFFACIICICWKKKIVIPLELAFLVITLLVGGLSVTALPSHKIGYDEEIHFGRAYFCGDTLLGKETVTSPYGVQELYSTWLSNWPLDLPQSEEERKEENIYRNEAADYTRENNGDGYWREDSNYTLGMGIVAYILPYLFIKFGMLLKLSFVYIYKMGRFANVLLYAFLGFFAIRRIPTGKRILLLFALMPTAMMSAITYTYDAWVNGFSFLAMAYLLGMWFDRKKKITWKEYIITVIAFVLASMPKAVYIPLILIVLLIPKERFENKKQMYLMKGIVIGAFLIMLSSFVWPTVSTTQIEGDSRGGDTSVSEQLKYIFTHPIYYSKLLVGSIGKTFYSYTIGQDGLAGMGHFRNVANTYLIAVSIAYTVGTDCTDEKTEDMKLWQKFSVSVIGFGVMCLIWTALYLSFTPVGLSQINGVQGRYYIPITIWILWILRNKKIVNKMNPARDRLAVIALSMGILLPIIYTNIIAATF